MIKKAKKKIKTKLASLEKRAGKRAAQLEKSIAKRKPKLSGWQKVGVLATYLESGAVAANQQRQLSKMKNKAEIDNEPRPKGYKWTAARAAALRKAQRISASARKRMS